MAQRHLYVGHVGEKEGMHIVGLLQTKPTFIHRKKSLNHKNT